MLAILNFSKDELSVGEYGNVREFLHGNEDVFALDDTDLGCTSHMQHEIDTSDHPPMKQHFRRVPFVHHEKISQMIDDMLEKGIIQPSSSPWFLASHWLLLTILYISSADPSKLMATADSSCSTLNRIIILGGPQNHNENGDDR